MKKLLIVMSLFTAPVFSAPAVDEPNAACKSADENEERCGGVVPPSNPDHDLFVEAVEFAKTSPDLAGIVTAVRVNAEWQLVDRTLEKKNPGPPSESTLDKLVKLAGRTGSAKGSVTITYVRVTGYSEKGQPLYETITFNAGAATGEASMAQESMNEAIGKSHR